MRILLSSHLFSPSVGGVETVSQLLAQHFMNAGNEVRVITQSVNAAQDRFPYQVFRQPTWAKLLALVRWAQVCLHNNVSLGAAWPLLLFPRPWVIAHQTWITRTDGSLGWRERVKRKLLRYATNVAISRAIAQTLPVRTVVIGNPYQHELFRQLPGVTRDRDLIFVGRLVSDKGVDVLLDALVCLRSEWNLRPTVTIVGAGPEEDAIRTQIARSDLANQVALAGVQQGEELVTLLNRHKILVAPSRWQEPFGIVALEGIACGCVVAGSEGGGLPDAIGPCGVTFPNGDSRALAEKLNALLTSPQQMNRYRATASAHLSERSGASVAHAYLRVLQSAFDQSRQSEAGFSAQSIGMP